MRGIMKSQLFRLLILVLVLFGLSSPLSARPYGQIICKKEGFTCLKIKSSRQTWASLWPDEYDRSIVMRINRMNVQLYPGLILAVPNKLKEADIMDFSPFPRMMEDLTEKVLIFDPKQLAWGAYNNDGELVRWGPASGGGDWCDDIDESCRTTEGTFRVFSAGSSECVSSKFPIPEGGAPMPYCMFFNEGQAFHGSPNGLAGVNSSHSCVRVYVNDAEWMRYEFVEAPSSDNQFRGTKVIVMSY
jgi:L,D-transpeptidase ErfK/SrfK